MAGRWEDGEMGVNMEIYIFLNQDVEEDCSWLSNISICLRIKKIRTTSLGTHFKGGLYSNSLRKHFSSLEQGLFSCSPKYKDTTFF